MAIGHTHVLTSWLFANDISVCFILCPMWCHEKNNDTCLRGSDYLISWLSVLFSVATSHQLITEVIHGFTLYCTIHVDRNLQAVIFCNLSRVQILGFFTCLENLQKS